MEELPLEIWAAVLAWTDKRTVAIFARVCRRARDIAYSDAVWGPLFRRALQAELAGRPVARVPMRVLEQGRRTLPMRTRYVRLWFWFYHTEVRAHSSRYPLSLSIRRPRMVHALLQSGVIPQSWGPEPASPPQTRPARTYRRRSPSPTRRPADDP